MMPKSKLKSNSSCLRDTILCPRVTGQTKSDKPSAIILSSPYDHPTDNAVKYSSVTSYVDAKGFRILNKRPLTFGENNFKRVFKPIFSRDRSKGVTVWLEAHGMPGWLFSDSYEPSKEAYHTKQFANYLIRLSEHLITPINAVVLSCCNSATEFTQSDPTKSFMSPARTLSLHLPGVPIVGFIGRNASAKVTNVFEADGDGYNQKILPLHDAAVVFQKGRIIESTSRRLYVPSLEAPEAIVEQCELDPDGFFLGLGSDELIDACLLSKARESDEKTESSGKAMDDGHAALQLLSHGASLPKMTHRFFQPSFIASHRRSVEFDSVTDIEKMEEQQVTMGLSGS